MTIGSDLSIEINTAALTGSRILERELEAVPVRHRRRSRRLDHQDLEDMATDRDDKGRLSDCRC